MKLVVAAALALIGVLVALFVITRDVPRSALVDADAAAASGTSTAPARALDRETRADTVVDASRARASSAEMRDVRDASSTPSPLVIATSHAERASLAAHAVDASGHPVAAARIRLVVDADESIERRRLALDDFSDDEMQHWIGDTDDDGRCTIANLPASLMLRPRIVRGPRVPVLEMDPISFASGERRSIEWRLNDGFEVSGIVLDQSDAPVADLDVMLQRPAAGLTPAYQIYSETDIVTRARTDRAGRFRLRAVPAGTWWLGPEPLGGPNQHTRDVAATALEIEVSPRAASLEFTLHVQRGLSIRGRVVDPSGAGAGDQWVTAQEEDSEVSFAVKSEHDGSFRVAPLRAGHCTLYAGGGDDAPNEFLAPSRPVTARAGDDGVVIRLEIGGALSVHAVDRRTKSGASARLWLSARDASSASLIEGMSAPDGTYRFAHLNAGTYDLGAQSVASSCGIAKGIVIGANAETKDVVVMLEPATMVLVRYEGGAPRASVMVKLDGVLLPGGGVLARGMTLNVPVPIGRSVLETQLLGKGKLPDQTIDATAGEVRTIVITDRE